MADVKKTTTTTTKPAAKKPAAKPAPKPAAKKTATKPAAKVTPKVAAKPAAKPAAKKPATKSAAKKAAPKPVVKKIDAKPSSLPKEVFGVKVNTQSIFDSIMSERASRRLSTHSVKTRGEVRGGGRKPFRQKGTGNARQGSIRSPQWVGGGIVWGPTTDKKYTLKVNKKVKRMAFNSALTLKAKNNAILEHDFKSGKKPSTKNLLNEVSSINMNKDFKKVLIITDDATVWKSASNLEKVFATKISSLTVETIVNADVLIFSKDSLSRIGGTK